jgi:hypothetical protein
MQMISVDIVTYGPFLGNELANTLPRRDWFLETNTVSMENESCKHLENQTIAWELKHGFWDSTIIFLFT